LFNSRRPGGGKVFHAAKFIPAPATPRGFGLRLPSGAFLAADGKRQRAAALQDAGATAWPPFTNPLNSVCADFILVLSELTPDPHSRRENYFVFL
jgi:hypothetical protein